MILFSPEYFAFIQEGSRQAAEEVVPLVLQLTKPDRVLDIGCGTGEWLKVFRDCGANTVLGVDAKWIESDTMSIRKDEFLVRDITEPLDIDGDFDLAIMLEAIQHVPEHRAREMVLALTRLAPCVLFSAPIPCQGGSGKDVHEQWPHYWAALFGERGFVCIDALRGPVWNNERVEWWYAQNILLFVSKAKLAESKALQAAFAANPGPPLPLVHPRLYTTRLGETEPHRRFRVEQIVRVLYRGLKAALASSRSYQIFLVATSQLLV